VPEHSAEITRESTKNDIKRPHVGENQRISQLSEQFRSFSRYTEQVAVSKGALSPVLAAQRRAAILHALSSEGALRIAGLADELGVSEVTIRRDVDVLQEQGLVEKVHGGVTTNGYQTGTLEPAFEDTQEIETRSKSAIAKEAAQLVSPGHAVALMGGSTVFALAKELVTMGSLTIVTNSIPVSDLFYRHGLDTHQVIVTGGVRTPTNSLVGPIAAGTLQRFNVDTVFMGAHGMENGVGFSTPNLLEADINRVAIAQSREVCVLADHTKWGARGFSTFATFGDIDTLITNDGMGSEALTLLSDTIDNVIVAQPAAESQ
jgi:DeoR/GlpR family transcriptional regulator of sugar metabolism